MINRNKKYKDATATPYPSVGQVLEHFAQQKHVNKAELGRRIGVNPNVVGSYFKKKSLQMGIIWNLSIALQHNFIAQIAEQMPIDFETKKETTLKNEILTLKEQMEKMEIELEVYKRITKAD